MSTVAGGLFGADARGGTINWNSSGTLSPGAKFYVGALPGTLNQTAGTVGSTTCDTYFGNQNGTAAYDHTGGVFLTATMDTTGLPALPIKIVDNGDAGFSTTGDWTSVSGEGFGNNVRIHSAGVGNNTATYTYTVTPGQYQVAITKTPASSLATEATYYVYDGEVCVARVVVDLTQSASFTDQGASWLTLGTFSITGNSLTVVLSDEGDENATVVADAVRIDTIAHPWLPIQLVDDGRY